MKNVLKVILPLGLVLVLWYLFLKPGEFGVSFKANTLPGNLIQVIKIWNRSLDNGTVLKVDSLNSLQQEIVWKGTTYAYNWSFEQENDTTTKVSVQVSQPDRRLLNKLLVPFTQQQIEVDAKEIGLEVYNIIKEHLRKTKVIVEGESEIKENFCVCVSLQTAQTEKALGMMKEYGLLVSFITENGLKPTGKPIIKINSWNHNEGTLTFDFCFPIEKQEYLPQFQQIEYKTITRQKALKANYFGNYITSDRAWYYLLDYASKNELEVDGLPYEYFFNNPNLGMNERSWKAEVYLPIK